MLHENGRTKIKFFFYDSEITIEVAPLFLLVLMIQPLKVLLVPLIYSRQVNFVMFSFKTAV